MAEDNSNTNTLSGVLSLDLASELAGATQHKPWQSGIYSRLLLKTDDLRLVLTAMDPGAKVKEHHADGSVSIHVLKGALRVHVQEQERDLHAGQILTLAPGIKHDLEAREDSAMLLTISWPKSEALQSLEHRGYGS